MSIMKRVAAARKSADATKDEELKDASSVDTDGLASRITDIEAQLAPLDSDIKELTPSDDLETVKRAVNELIRAINGLL